MKAASLSRRERQIMDVICRLGSATAAEVQLDRAQLPVMRLYDLRHSSATLLLAAGVNAKVVSERLGHSTVRLTLDTYSHVLPSMRAEAADILGKLITGALSRQS